MRKMLKPLAICIKMLILTLKTSHLRVPSCFPGDWVLLLPRCTGGEAEEMSSSQEMLQRLNRGSRRDLLTPSQDAVA